MPISHWVIIISSKDINDRYNDGNNGIYEAKNAQIFKSK